MRVRVLSLLATLLASASLASPGENAGAAGARLAHREGEVIVRFAGRVGAAAMQATVVRGHAEARVARTLAGVGRPGTALVRFPKGVPVQDMASRLRELPGVRSVEPNYMSPARESVAVSPPAADRRARHARRGDALGDPSSRPRTDAELARMGDFASLAAAPGTTPGPSGYASDPNAYDQGGYYWLSAEVIFPEKAQSPMVAVLSTGVDSKHPDLVGKIVKGTDWVNADLDPDDDHGLGTGLAGVVAAVIDNSKGITGLSNGKVLAIKIMDSEFYSTAFDDAGAILEAANNPLVKVILLGDWWGDPEILVLRDAVEGAVGKGKLLVLPASDLDSSTPSFPAAYADAAVYPGLAPSVVSVGSVGLANHPFGDDYAFTDYDCRAPRSNYGPWVSMDAPGEAVFSTTPTHSFWMNVNFGVTRTYGYPGGGTIMAGAQVAGAAARTWSTMPAGTTAAQVKQRMMSRAYDHVPYAQGVTVDTDGDGTPDTPCYPAMANTVTVTPNIASAMARVALTHEVLDAHGGLELFTPATFSASMGGLNKGWGGALQAGTHFRIVNLAMDNVNGYDFKVNAPGYTTGSVTFHPGVVLGDCGGGLNTANCVSLHARRAISLARNLPGQIHVVTDWFTDDLDTHLFTPSSAPIQCDVGISPISPLFCFLGSLKNAPFARLLHDGGPGHSADARSELLSIKAPFYPTTSGTPYRIILTDHDNNYLRGSKALTRVWTGGKMTALVAAENGDVATNDCSYVGGANTCGAFWVGDLSGAGVFTPRAIYGTLSAVGPAGVLPYGAPRGAERRR